MTRSSVDATKKRLDMRQPEAAASVRWRRAIAQAQVSGAATIHSSEVASGQESRQREVRDDAASRPRALSAPDDHETPTEKGKHGGRTELEELDKLIAKGKQKGFLTYDEVNDALPSDVVSLDQLDDIMLLFGSMDIELVDSAKALRLPSEIEDPRRAGGDEPTDRRDRPHAGAHGPHRGPRPALPPRDGQGLAPHPRGRDHPRQADRGGQGRGHGGHAVHQARHRQDPPPARQAPPRRHPDQGRGRLQRGGVDRGEGGGAAPHRHPRARQRRSPPARAGKAAATARQIKAKNGTRKRQGRPPVEEVRRAGAGKGAGPRDDARAPPHLAPRPPGRPD